MKTLVPSTGFHHNGRTVFAVAYELEPPAGFASAFLIVWLTPEGADANAFTMPSDPSKWIVQARPGDTILHRGEPKKVRGVKVWHGDGASQYG